jgi:hypothetical protein
VKFAESFGALEGAERTLSVAGCPGIVAGCISTDSGDVFKSKVQAVLHLAPLVSPVSASSRAGVSRPITRRGPVAAR